MASVITSEESIEDSKVLGVSDRFSRLSEQYDVDTDLESECDSCSSEEEPDPFLRMIFMNGSDSIVPIHSPTLMDVKIHAAIVLQTLYPCIHLLSVASGKHVTSRNLAHARNVFVVNNTTEDLAALPARQLLRVMRRHAANGDHNGVMLCAHIAADHNNTQSATSIVRSWILTLRDGDRGVKTTLARSWVYLCEEDPTRHDHVLIDAAGSGDQELVIALLEAHAVVDAVNANGDTALLKAARAGYCEVVRQLVEFGADVAAKNKHGEVAIGPASRGGHKKIVSILLEHGATPPAKTREARRPKKVAPASDSPRGKKSRNTRRAKRKNASDVSS